MGDPQLDDSIGHLERFNQTLSTLTPQLEEQAAELGVDVGALRTLAGELQGKLTAARSSVDAIDDEIATFATAAETEAEGIGDLALTELDQALSTLDGSVRELADDVPQQLTGRAETLEQDLESLQSQGFAPLHQMMNALARGAFGNWAATAAETLGRLDEQVDTVVEEVTAHREKIDEPGAWIVQQTEVSAWSPVQVATAGVDSRIPSTVTGASLAGDLTAAQETAYQQGLAATQDLRTQLGEVVQQASEPISQRTLALVDTVSTTLDACEIAEHGVGEGDEEASAAVQRAAALVDLAERIETAEGELRHVQSVLQSMDAP